MEQHLHDGDDADGMSTSAETSCTRQQVPRMASDAADHMGKPHILVWAGVVP